MTTWNKVDDFRETKFFDAEKIVVVRPSKQLKTTTPLFCPLCSFPMKTFNDTLAYVNKQCCELCELKWKGTKPTDQNLWNDYLNYRYLTSITEIKLK